MSVVLVAMAAACCLGPVELRGGLLVDAPVTSVSIRGVEVGGTEARVIGWDNVKRVMGGGADAATPYMEMAEHAWRARIRLARGDFGMASGLLEELYGRLKGEDGPTALMVAEGTMACRLWYADRVGAVDAWLEAVRLRSKGEKIAGDPPLHPMVDPDTLLTPALAPVWLETDALMELAVSWSESAAAPEDVAQRLRVLYAASARRALGMAVDEEAVAAAAFGGESRTGVALVGQMVQAMALDPARRASARAALRAGLAGDSGTWREAWRRAALGRSLLLEEDEASRLAGLFELVHLPARFSRSQPQLAGMALAEMSLELMRRGEPSAGERLRRELETRYPGSGSLAWLEQRIRAMRETGDNQDSGAAVGSNGVPPESETIDEHD